MKNVRFEMKVAAELLGRVDQWRGRQSDVPNRSEAIRRLIEAGLSRAATDVPSGGGGSGSPRKSVASENPSLASRLKKPAAPPRKAETVAAPRSKLDQIRALRERDA